MKYSPDEIMQYIEEEDVKFIRLAFTDIYGKQKNISVMPDELEKAFRNRNRCFGNTGLRL